MDWTRRLSPQSRRLLSLSQSELASILEAGWRGDATRREPDLQVMLDYLEIGFVGIYPKTGRGRSFMVHGVLGGSEEPEKAELPLAILDAHGVALCAVPVWPTILSLATAMGLALEINEAPDSITLSTRWYFDGDES